VSNDLLAVPIRILTPKGARPSGRCPIIGRVRPISEDRLPEFEHAMRKADLLNEQEPIPCP
jgi:hypothetical protein